MIKLNELTEALHVEVDRMFFKQRFSIHDFFDKFYRRKTNLFTMIEHVR